MDEIAHYYNLGKEQNRLTTGASELEQVRTRDILSRYLPEKGVIYDIGGGAGIYALPLATLGYQVHLLDLMPLHVQQAEAASAQQPDSPLASIRVGDARHVDFADSSADAVLLLGPLYHLTERADRVQAFKEAYRVLKPGGQVFAATISRFASMIDGFGRNFIRDDAFAGTLKQTLATGQHRNPSRKPGYFTTAYFHKPEEVPAEMEEAGFTWKASLAVEGVAWADNDFLSKWENPQLRTFVLELLEMTEAEATLIGASPHLMTIGSKSA